MAEVPTPHYVEPGHRFDAGPYLLDLYRLLCTELGDRLVVRETVKSRKSFSSTPANSVAKASFQSDLVRHIGQAAPTVG
jgi:hypothetical protein